MRRRRDVRGLGIVVGAGVLAALAGCDANFWDPTRFGPLRDNAPVAVLPSPGPGPLGGRFGELVVGIETWVPHGGATPVFLPASRVGAAGGMSSPFFVYAGFDDGLASPTMTLGPHPTLPTRLLEGCTDLVYCGEGSGRSITALPSWSYEGRPVHGCVAAPAGVVTQRPLPPNEMIQIRCETQADTIGFVDVPDGIEFGASAAPLPATVTNGCPPVPHPVGAAVFGAPSDAGGGGGIYVLLPPPFASVVAVDLAIPLTPGDGLGSSIAAVGLPDGTALVAASTIGASRRVVLAGLRAAGPGEAPEVLVHACLTGSGRSFGHALAFGDLDGDGSPELVAGGADASITGAAGVTADAPVSIWRTEALLSLDGAGCAPGSIAPRADLELGCPSGVTGLVCGTAAAPGNSGFGTSVAIGDIDGDREDDLVVGAPLAASSTGAVVVFPGGNPLDRLSSEVGRVATSTMRVGALLGYSVATLRGTDRDEIIAGAPGISEVDVILCTDLMGDRASEHALAPEGTFRTCARRVAGVAAPMCGTAMRDAGPGADAGLELDAGDLVDAGEEPDAGEPDAGDLDAGAASRIDAP